MYYAHHLFLNGEEVKELFIPNSVSTIRRYAFEGCSSLTSVNIPNSVESIGEMAFNGCSGLTRIQVESSNPYYDSRNNCNAIIETTSNTLIQGCQNTTIPNSVTSIGCSAFEDCLGLTSISIPNSVTSIGNSAFRACSDLNSIAIPNSVTSIGWFAFSGCSELNDVYSYIINPALISMDGSVFYRYPNNYTDRTLHVPYGTSEPYQTDTNWSQYFGSIVEMDPVPASSIDLDKTEAVVIEGETMQLTATVLPEDATYKAVTWASSDPTVAAVSNEGLVAAVGLGAATITAMTTDGTNLSASCDVTVLQEIELAESIQLNVTTAGLNEGSSLQLTATVLPENCDNTVLWASNNPSIATVDSNGLVTTHGIGTATITAITTDGSNLSTTCTVTLLPVGVRGDVNNDGNISITDVTTLINYLLSGHF